MDKPCQFLGFMGVVRGVKFDGVREISVAFLPFESATPSLRPARMALVSSDWAVNELLLSEGFGFQPYPHTDRARLPAFNELGCHPLRIAIL